MDLRADRRRDPVERACRLWQEVGPERPHVLQIALDAQIDLHVRKGRGTRQSQAVIGRNLVPRADDGRGRQTVERTKKRRRVSAVGCGVGHGEAGQGRVLRIVVHRIARAVGPP